MFRSEYLKLGSDLPGLAREFGHQLTDQQRQDALVLALAMDQIDDRIDALPGLEQRQAVYHLVLDSLAHGQRDLGAESEAFRFALTGVRAAAVRAGQLSAFCEVVEELMLLGESLRQVESPTRYAALAVREADVTVALLYLILSPASPGPRFRRFLRQSGVVGNLTDKLVDLGEDRREGRSRVRWGAWWPLTRIILAASLEIPRLHPHPPALLRWGAGYLAYGLRYQLGLEPRLRDYAPNRQPAPLRT